MKAHELELMLARVERGGADANFPDTVHGHLTRRVRAHLLELHEAAEEALTALDAVVPYLTDCRHNPQNDLPIGCAKCAALRARRAARDRLAQAIRGA